MTSRAWGLSVCAAVTSLAAYLPASLAQTAFPWQETPCAQLPLAHELALRCQKRSGGASKSEANTGQSIQYTAHGQLGQREAIFWLLWFENDWTYSTYGSDLSDSIIRKQIQPSLTSGASNWGAMQSFGNTAFLTFEAKGKKCVGFDHGGPLTKNLRAEGSGYPWLLRGILCDVRSQAYSRTDLEYLLRSGVTPIVETGL